MKFYILRVPPIQQLKKDKPRVLLRKFTLKKAKRKFWNTQFVLSTLSKINQKQNKIDISI
jgi:hypothetical protein